MEYKGYTIEVDKNYGGYGPSKLIFYPTSEGIQHDCDFDYDGYRYCGNCGWADNAEEAMDSIDEIIMKRQPQHQVKTNEGIKSFDWLSDAARYAIENNGILLTQIESI